MRCVRVVDALGTALLAACVSVCPAYAREATPPGAVGDMIVPGGARAAMAAAGDAGGADRNRFLLDLIHRSFSGPLGEREWETAVPALLGHLEKTSPPDGDVAGVPPASRPDGLPLPLPASIWTDVVFGGGVTAEQLLGAILKSRSASLLYYGLLSLDDPTRAWLAGQPDVVRDLASQHAAAFVLAAPALRVVNGTVRVPGGARAEPVWESLVGRRVHEPAAFVRALLAYAEGRLAYFYGATAPLTPSQIAVALALDAEDPEDRSAAARRILAVFQRVAKGWRIDRRPLWRPALDPALLVADLRLDANGRPVVPGTQRFWRAVFASPAGDKGVDAARIVADTAADFPWLCEHVFNPGSSNGANRYRGVLFASRLGLQLSEANAPDAVAAVRAAVHFPALAAALERARLRDLSVFARASRRAARLSDIGREQEAARALSQFQGALSLLVRAATRGDLQPAALATLVSSLSDVEHDDRGNYDGALVRWLTTHLGAGSDDLEANLIRWMAGSSPAEPRVVEWEGTRYVVDFAHAEALRVSRLLGEDAPRYLSSAGLLVTMADQLEGAQTGREQARALATQLEDIAVSAGLADADGWAVDARDRYRRTAEMVEGIANGRAAEPGAQLPRQLRLLADDLLARGLLVLAYASALGQPDRVWVAAHEVARRHTFHMRPAIVRSIPWELPVVGNSLRADSSAVGSLLGLDVAYAELSLVRLSLRPPPRRPTMADAVRRAFATVVVLVRSPSLADGDRDAIAAALQDGRRRLAGVRTHQDAVALADELALSPARSSLLSWTLRSDPGRLEVFLSPGELLRLGLGRVPQDSTLHEWGAPAGSRMGCLCLRLPDGLTWEALAGRLGSGLLVSAFPDLNLRLAELLAEMRLPASLLGPVLASATLDFVSTAIARGEDDRQGLVEFVQALGLERMEGYLALLTGDGPLVPLDEDAEPAQARDTGR